MKENINPCPHRVVGDPCPSCQEENEKKYGNSPLRTVDDSIYYIDMPYKPTGIDQIFINTTLGQLDPTTNIVSYDDDLDDYIQDITVEDCDSGCKQSKTKCTHKNGYTTLVRGKLYCTECIIENLIPVGDF